MRNFSIAIDADLLLSQVSMSNSLQSLQDGHYSLDIVVQRQVKEILSMFWSRYQITVVVVLEGLKPACLADSSDDHEMKSLKKSHAIWQAVKKCKDEGKGSEATNGAVLKSILREYGSRFYMQEVINATKEVPNCTFFVAPYTQTAQLAQFYADSLIQVAFGTSKLLCHGDFEQAIVDFNVTAGTFTFIDRADLKLDCKELLPLLARFFILSGAVYGITDMKGDLTWSALQAQLVKACDKNVKSPEKKDLLKPCKPEQKMRFV